MTLKRITSLLASASLALSGFTSTITLVNAEDESFYGEINGDPIISEVELDAEVIDEAVSEDTLTEATDLKDSLTLSESEKLITLIVEMEQPCVIDAGLEPGSDAALAYAANLINSQNNAAAQALESVPQNSDSLNAIGTISDNTARARHYTNVFNGFAMDAPAGFAVFLLKTPGVKNVYRSRTYEIPDFSTDYETDMFTSGDMIGINLSYSSGYQGEGMVVGILDTGLDTTHTAFSASPSTQKITRSTRFSGLNASSTYKSAKVPFAYDYADSDTNVIPGSGGSSHGTHVAGTIAGSNDVITGIAPEAQLAIFKVFSDSSKGAKDEWIISALEDVVIVKPDAINMSLGSPAGDEGDSETGSFNGSTLTMAEIYQRVYDAGVLLSVSAGNESYIGASNGYPSADSPNVGIVGAPSTYPASLSVASIENTHMICDYFELDGEVYNYSDTSESSSTLFTTLGSKLPLQYVDCGCGSAEEIAAVDVSGKIALIQRGGLAFTEKQANAKNAGAVAAIIYNNVEGTINMSIDSSSIPCISVTKQAGQKMLASATKTITAVGSGKSFENADAYQMSDFSSWGTTDNLSIKPEVTAPGGHIYSSVVGGGYADYSGTSMAAPHVSGVMALVRQYAKSAGLASSGTDLNRIVNQLIMSTAKPVPYPGSDCCYSPRKTGAGLVNINDAMAAHAYLSVSGTEDSRPKIELGYDASRNGTYTMKFNVTNISNTAQTYNVDAIVQTDYVEDGYDTLSPYSLGYTLSGDTTVTVNAKATKSVTVYLTLTEDARAYLLNNYPSGGFVEGYIVLDPMSSSADATQLSLPFIGFSGDWSNLPLFDASVLNGSQAAVGVNGPFGYEAYVELDTDNGQYDAKLIGMNAYDPDYEYFSDVDPRYMTVSSTIDSSLSSYVTSYPYICTYDRNKTTGISLYTAAVKQNANWVRFRVLDTNSGTVYYDDGGSEQEVLKNYEPQYYALWNILDVGWPGTNKSGKALSEGTECTLEVSMSKDGGSTSQSMTFPIAIDNSKPYIVGTSQSSGSTSTQTYSKAILATTASGRKYLKFKAADNYYLSAAQVSGTTVQNSTDSNTRIKYYYLTNVIDTQAFYGTEKGAEYEAVLDVTDISGSIYYVGLYDYTRWKSFYKVTASTSATEKLTLDPAETTVTLDGEPVSLSYTVTDESGYTVDPYDLIWTVESQQSNDTAISEDGVLTVGANERSEELTVTAALADDTAVSATAKVTVINNTDPVTELKMAHKCSFGNDLSISYYAPKDILEGYENIYLTVSKQNYVKEDDSYTWADYTLSNYTEATESGTDYYKFVFNHIAAKEMGSEMHAILHATKDGVEYESPVDVYGIKTYAMNRLARSTNSVFKTLMVDMLNYGAAAQIYFDYDTENLVNADLTEEQKALGTAEAPELTSHYNMTEIENPGVTFPGMTVVFGSNTEIKYYMQYADDQPTDNTFLRLTYTTAAGTSVKADIPFAQFGYDSERGAYTAKLNKLAAKDMGTVVTAQLYNGEEAISGQLEYSIETYVFNRLNNSTDENFKTLITEMMKYSRSAKAYLGN